MGGDKQPQPWAQGGGGAEGGKGDRRSLLTWVSSVEESKRIPMPSHEASPSRTEPTWPLPRVYHTACGSPAAQPGAGGEGACRTLNLGLTTHLPDSPPLPGVVWGHSPCPGLPAALTPSPSSAHAPPRQRRGQGPCSTRRHCGSAWTGPAALPPGPVWHLWTGAAQGQGPTIPYAPISLTHWPGLGPGAGRK